MSGPSSGSLSLAAVALALLSALMGYYFSNGCISDGVGVLATSTAQGEKGA